MHLHNEIPARPRLEMLKSELVNGVGFAVLSGLNIAHHERKIQAALYLAVGAHIGRVKSQNANGHLLGHARDQVAHASDPTTRIYQTAERQTIHTDSADVVGLLCLREALEGEIRLWSALCGRTQARFRTSTYA